MSDAAQTAPALPCVVQLGFAGSRTLFSPAPATKTDSDRFREELQRYLTGRLKKLPEELKLDGQYFLCGISQVAIGADMLFTQACAELKTPQRIFLPQHRQDFLNATASDGTPDFTDEERVKAERLLAGEQIIQERVVADAAERTARFDEANLEILRVSDIVVCLLREDATGKAGSTSDLLERAKKRNKLTLEIRFTVANGHVEIHEQWHNRDQTQGSQWPRLPADLPVPDQTIRPDKEGYLGGLYDLASQHAKRHQKLFRLAARIIIGTHIAATICATLVLAFHASVKYLLLLTAGLLPLELVLLVSGFLVHFYLHRSRAARVWALSRLVAEILRSIKALQHRHFQLHYLFQLPMPLDMLPLLRTINVLHLRATRPHRNDPWEQQRDAYIANRLDDKDHGQLIYYEKERTKDERRWRICNWTFGVCSSAAILAVLCKLIIVGYVVFGVNDWDLLHLTRDFLGVLAIILPLLSVAALSWMAAMDFEARIHTYTETLNFLNKQRPLLEQAKSAAEFERLVLETESRLLGETVSWYARRAFTGVT